MAQGETELCCNCGSNSLRFNTYQAARNLDIDSWSKVLAIKIFIIDLTFVLFWDFSAELTFTPLLTVAGFFSRLLIVPWLVECDQARNVETVFSINY